MFKQNYFSHNFYALFLCVTHLTFHDLQTAPSKKSFSASTAYPFKNTAPALQNWNGNYNPALPQNVKNGSFRAATSRWGKHQNNVPKPTNRWFLNSTFDDGNVYPVNTFPFLLFLTNNPSVQICLPGLAAINASKPLQYGPTFAQAQNFNNAICFNNDFEFSTTEPLSAPTIISKILNEPLSITYACGVPETKGFIIPMVRGMPYVTFITKNITPRITTATHTFISVNGQTTTGQSTLSDTFAITLDNGQVWYFLFSTPVSIWFDIQTNGFQTMQPFSGTLRITEQSIFNNNPSLINAYKNCSPISGSVSFNGTQVYFDWNTIGTGPLLMMALPHHHKLLAANHIKKNITYNSVRGMMVGVETAQKNNRSSWTLHYSDPTAIWGDQKTAWTSPRSPASDKITAIKAALSQETILTTESAAVYNFAKEIARLARLALIANEVNNTTMQNTILTNIKTALTPWIHGTNPDALLYDVNTANPGPANWGGICSTNGLNDSDADFGQGWYNDHHFHYGYFIYSAAVYIYLSDNKKSPFIKQLTLFAYDLIRDIANPTADTYFPDYRMMDWYLGHSLASGLFPLPYGKNQESTSEAVNAWYGIYLFGLATKDLAIANLGKILLAAEIHSAQTYWFLVPTTKAYEYLPSYNIYPKAALYANEKTNPCVGILWENMADFKTFFDKKNTGKNNEHPIEFLNLIHFLPFTPVTEILIPKAWNSFQYGLATKSDYNNSPTTARALKNALTQTIPDYYNGQIGVWQSWKGLIYMSLAISDPNQAWQTVAGSSPTDALQYFDNGNSATNMLYWIATRP